MKKPKNYNYNYYEHMASEAFVTADETKDNARAQLFLLDQNGTAAPKEVDYDCGLVKEDPDDNG